MRFKERKCGAHGEHGVKAYMETGMRSVRMMAAMHVQEYVPKRNKKKKKNKASCAYNHVQPKLNLWPLMSTKNNEISCIYCQVMKQDVKRQKLTKLKEASSLWFPQAVACLPPQKKKIPPAVSFLFPPKTPVYVFLSKPLLAPLFIPQQAWRFSTTSMTAIPPLLHVQCNFLLAEKRPPYFKKK